MQVSDRDEGGAGATVQTTARDGAPHAHGDEAIVAPDPDAVAEAAGLFRAAGDPERLRLLAMLSGGERCVSELAEALGAGMPAVSQRLRVLRTEGLVSRRREGKHAFYRLADEHVADLIDSALAHAAEPDDRRHRGAHR